MEESLDITVKAASSENKSIEENLQSDNKDKTIKFLKKLVQTKEDVIKHKEVEKNYLRRRIIELEKLMNEKEEYVKVLEKNLGDLYATEKDTESSKDEDRSNQVKRNVSIKKTDVKPSEKSKVKLKSKNKEKCVFEDNGKCRMREKCPNIHPRNICPNFSKYGKCNKRNSCQGRHLKNVCYDWQKDKVCSRGERCRFRHPQEPPKKDFLEKSFFPPLQPSPLMQNHPIFFPQVAMRIPETTSSQSQDMVKCQFQPQLNQTTVNPWMQTVSPQPSQHWLMAKSPLL